MITRRTTLQMAGATLALASTPSLSRAATTHEILMLNRDPDDRRANMVYRPEIVVAQPGDTLRFVPTDRGHNVVSYDTMWPDGADAWRTRPNAEFETVVEIEGAYGYYCQPHKAMGMVGLVLVGNPMSNYERAKATSLRGREKQRWDAIWAEADTLVSV